VKVDEESKIQTISTHKGTYWMNRLSFDIKTTPEVIKTTPLLEQNYSQIDREALALVFVLDKFHIYIYGCKFTLITDNRPLTNLLSSSQTSAYEQQDFCVMHYIYPPLTMKFIERTRRSYQRWLFIVAHFQTSNQILNQALLDRKDRMLISDSTSNVNAEITSSLIAKHTATDPELAKIWAEKRQWSKHWVYNPGYHL